ncbi:hypothetical protein QYE76_025570 [Lolium multiflorum]|uniref:Uncharacterized protein n=1 Tax=Lolium multiflorum TaxID=4521 RepID=A0AAD8RIU1_LOLMU|nr:hypothetical protein QYE76_025570 [Lolium multiflorum]
MSFDPREVDMFVQFFHNFRRPTELVAFYHGEVASMELRNATTLCVDYNDVKCHNLEAASLLSFQDLQSSEQLVLEAFNMFLRVNNSPVRGNVTSIQFYNYPGRYESLEDFLSRNPPVEAFELPDRITTAICTPAGRMVLQGFIHCLVEGHAKGNSWRGSFEVSHLVIVNLDSCRQECRILKQPTATLTRPVNLATMQLDFERLAQILLRKFGVILTPGDDRDTQPAFFMDLGLDMRMHNIPAAVHYNSKFTKFICRHMAFLPSLSRSNMIVNLIRVYKVLSVNERYIFTASVDRAKRGPGDWRTDARFYELLKKVYDGKLGRAPYGNNGMDLLLFQRHFVVHAGDHLKLSNGNRSIETLEAIDYYLAHHYDQFLSKVVYRLIIDLDIGKLLEKVWENLHPGYHEPTSISVNAELAP